ncbi:hypothetical protein HYPSUDRAFT_33340 [Hypholoma sublateritium FD-334 SS-4]|uniref:Uncharacterized protein n=1 Tax=Hypholoma sublateritium (strain FD-334 SS-4) TaxID=945553 RepID=A0A0D2QB50_HYPSF|nr:hypothetical protein HYPSUDRAFT_33340 [Hypholoma sublateritium FD-334 SS-4]
MSSRRHYSPLPRPHVLEPAPKIFYNLHTLYLFIKSDVVGILLPIVIFATLSTRHISLTRILQSSTWTAVHLLQFCVSNQSLSPEEDRKNKPWRPIPAGRVTVTSAYTLRWSLIPVCLALSTMYGVLDVSLILTSLIFLHNEAKHGKNWLARSFLNAAAYATFDAGATLISCGDRQEFNANKIFPVIVNAFIILTTIHAQDFRDEEGDRHEGRRTIPIVAPWISRVTMPILLLSWSLLITARVAPVLVDWFILLLGWVVGVRFYYLRTRSADDTSYALYNIWLLSIRVLLCFSRSY